MVREFDEHAPPPAFVKEVLRHPIPAVFPPHRPRLKALLKKYMTLIGGLYPLRSPVPPTLYLLPSPVLYSLLTLYPLPCTPYPGCSSVPCPRHPAAGHRAAADDNRSSVDEDMFEMHMDLQ
eukprot:gene11106-9690_t